MYLTDLDEALREGGIGYWEASGWRSRGHGGMSGVRGVLIHHTAGGGSNDWVTVRDGRPDLGGPLAHMTLERDGSVRILAAGLCWHAGGGAWHGVTNGNGYFIGIEGVSNGSSWTDAQRATYPKLAAALARHYGFPVDMIAGHKEYALPKGRKIDPGNWDMGAFRADAAKYLSGGGSAGNRAQQFLLL